jgi:hypothetical protein
MKDTMNCANTVILYPVAASYPWADAGALDLYYSVRCASIHVKTSDLAYVLVQESCQTSG